MDGALVMEGTYETRLLYFKRYNMVLKMELLFIHQLMVLANEE